MPDQSISRFIKTTNPLASSVAGIASQLVRDATKSIDLASPPLTAVNRRLPNPQIAKTNPQSNAVQLPPRKRALARLLAEGKSTAQIASALGVSRQSVWKWSREPEVGTEADRFHAELLRLSSAAVYRR